MTVDTAQQYQETVEADSNILCQLKQIYNWLSIAVIICQINKGRENMAIPSVEEVANVSSYPLL